MPFGINLPGPFTLSAQDKSSKKLLAAHKADKLAADTAARQRRSFENKIIKHYGERTALKIFTDIAAVEQISPVLAERRRKECLAVIREAKAEAKARAKAAKQAAKAGV